MIRHFGILFLAVLFGCAGSKKGIAPFDITQYDTNNTLTTFEHQQATATIYITSTPSSADIFMDKKFIGKANKDVVRLLPGKHEITLIKGDMYYRDTLYFQTGNNTSLHITLKKK